MVTLPFLSLPLPIFFLPSLMVTLPVGITPPALDQSSMTLTFTDSTPPCFSLVAAFTLVFEFCLASETEESGAGLAVVQGIEAGSAVPLLVGIRVNALGAVAV